MVRRAAAGGLQRGARLHLQPKGTGGSAGPCVLVSLQQPLVACLLWHSPMLTLCRPS
jgi:hypothetical protein